MIDGGDAEPGHNVLPARSGRMPSFVALLRIHQNTRSSRMSSGSPHCHLVQCFDTTPRLAFMSAEKASGKTPGA